MKNLKWEFRKTIEISKDQREKLAPIIREIFLNGMELKNGWKTGKIIKTFDNTTVLGLLKEGDSKEYKGYFFASIPKQKMHRMSIIWIDAVTLKKNIQGGGYLRKGIDIIKSMYRNHNFGYIGGRSQNPVIYHFLSKIGKGELLPFDREYFESEMEFLISNLSEVRKPMEEGSLNMNIGICKKAYNEGVLGNYPFLKDEDSLKREEYLQGKLNRKNGDTLIVLKHLNSFKEMVLEGIPEILPDYDMNSYYTYDEIKENRKYVDGKIPHSSKRDNGLNKPDDKQLKELNKLALQNALRYFEEKHHKALYPEFKKELEEHGRIYMYRFKPKYKITARKISDFPYKTIEAGAIMLMISNNLDNAVAQFPHELITYGSNGAVFQNWAQYRLTMKYLAEMTDKQTLVLNSGHPLGLFPSNKNAPRVVISNGMVIPNYSSLNDYDRFNTIGVSQYGQMTAGSFMYIGPQGIVHGTNITLLSAKKMLDERDKENGTYKKNKIRLFVSSGLGGMSGAQPKAAKIAGIFCVIAEIDKTVVERKMKEGYIDEKFDEINQTVPVELINKIKKVKNGTINEIKAYAYVGNIVNLWEKLAEEHIEVDMGSDQTSLHNPFGGGYYPVGFTFEEARTLLKNNKDKFEKEVRKSLVRHVKAINKLSDEQSLDKNNIKIAGNKMYFFDYGNDFLEQAKNAIDKLKKELSIVDKEASIDHSKNKTKYKYASYVQDIMGPKFFDYGFGPFRWVCTSSNNNDLIKTDEIASKVLNRIYNCLSEEEKVEIGNQIKANIKWIEDANKNQLVLGSKARILYSNEEGRIKIALAFNKAVKEGVISAPIVIGRDHHDVSGTDSNERETSNIYDGSNKTADMAIQNVIGDSFRGATWVSIHNGGGTGWGKAINGGFGLVLDGSKKTKKKLKSMLAWDVNNGIARRSWGGNINSKWAIKKAMCKNNTLKITISNIVDKKIFENK